MRNLTLAALLASLAMPVLADDAALLLGVSRYTDLGRVTDGTDIVRGVGDLRDAGYQTRMLRNGASADVLAQLGLFVADAEDADRIIVALSGKFVTSGDRTWFLTADAPEPTLFGMQSGVVSVESVMQVLAGVPGQAVLLIGYDESDNASIGPYLREGLGAFDIPQGVTVISGRPGSMAALVKDAITKEGENLIAYVAGNRRLRASGYTPKTLVMQAADAQTTAAAPAAEPETDPVIARWEEARAADTADAYRNFIFRFPNSPYTAEARRRLDVIENDPIRLDQLAEERMNLTRNQRRQIQRDLTVLSFSTRGVDGIFGPGSRGAIRNWQQANGFTQTGYVTREQVNRIDAQASRRRAEIAAEEERAREEALRLDRAYWEETGQRGDEAGFRAYLDRFPQGAFANQARQQLAEIERQRTAAQEDARAAEAAAEEEARAAALERARAQESALDINPILARLIESRLAQLGYDPGRADGRFDQSTRRALAQYQQSRNLPATGYLNEPTLARLLADTFQ